MSGLAEPDLDALVVGAGVAGLATAHRLRRAGRSVRVLEASHRVGGRMASSVHDGFLVDEGAEAIARRGYDATWDLIRQAGVPQSEVLPIQGTYAVWRDGRAHARCGHPAGLLTGAGMSWRGRLDWLRFTAALARQGRAFDPDHPEDTPLGDRTISRHTQGRDRELHDYLLQPLAAHCFGWRPERSAVAPMVSHLLAVGGAATRWMAYRSGMDTLARALARHLDVRTDAPVRTVEPGRGRVTVHLADGGSLSARRVVLAVPAPLALALHPEVPDDERPYLEASGYAPMLKVSCLLDRALPAPTHSPSWAFGVPEVESRVCAGAILDHFKAPGRAPAGCGQVSLFVSPRTSPALLDAADDVVVATVCDEAERFLPGLKAATRRTLVHRFRHGLPEATPEALRLRGAFLARPVRGVDYAGDWVMLRPSSEGAVRSASIVTQRILAAD